MARKKITVVPSLKIYDLIATLSVVSGTPKATIAAQVLNASEHFLDDAIYAAMEDQRTSFIGHSSDKKTGQVQTPA